MTDKDINSFLEFFADMVAEKIAKKQSSQDNVRPITARRLKGLNAIMTIAQCGRTKAQELKDSGILDDAIIYTGPRSYVVDEAKAITCLEKHKKGGGRNYGNKQH